MDSRWGNRDGNRREYDNRGSGRSHNNDRFGSRGDEPSRGDNDGSWRRGGSGGGGFGSSRGGYGSRGGYDNDNNYGSRGGGYGSRNDGYGRGGDRGFGNSDRAPPAERPRFNLQKRSVPVENADGSTAQTKSNPFGGATAADTASKLAALDIKKKDDATEEQPQEESAPAEENNVQNEDVADKEKSEKNEDDDKNEKRDRNNRRREPKVINSRAAAFGDAPAATSGMSGRSREVSLILFDFYDVFISWLQT